MSVLLALQGASDITDAGTAEIVGEVSGLDALVDQGTVVALDVPEGLEALLDTAAATIGQVPSADEALADLGESAAELEVSGAEEASSPLVSGPLGGTPVYWPLVQPVIVDEGTAWIRIISTGEGAVVGTDLMLEDEELLLVLV